VLEVGVVWEEKQFVIHEGLSKILYFSKIFVRRKIRSSAREVGKNNI